MKGKTRLAVKWLSRFGAFKLLHLAQAKNRLTVLNYHRIADVHAEEFVGYPANVSTNAEGYAAQMDYVAKHFNVISLEILYKHVTENSPLPDYPLLISFDDGYLDNYEQAMPILKQHQFPAVIFLMTSRMQETHELPWWDAIAEAIKRTKRDKISLAEIGDFSLKTDLERKLATDEIIKRCKLFPEEQKKQLLTSFLNELAVDLSLEKPLFVNWEQVRELVANKIACQAHTHNHPILTRISEEEIRAELQESSRLIAEKTKQTVYAFAYPNGTPVDYDARAIRILKELDFRLAFTLSHGPMPAKEVKNYPLQIKRIFLIHTDSFEIFQSKVMGLPALLKREAYQIEG